MLFNTIEFLVFLPIVFGLYWLPVRKGRWQNAVVVGASTNSHSRLTNAVKQYIMFYI